MGLLRKEYMRAYRVWQWIRQNRRGLVRGLPGTGKSTYVLLACLLFNDEFKIVYAVPLRQLRDSLHRRILTDPRFGDVRDKVTVVHAHDEVCEPLRARLLKNNNYLVALAEHIRAVKEGREECKWRDEIKKAMKLLMDNKPRLILTTHVIAFMLRLIEWVVRNRNVIFIFDEAEELFVTLGEGIDVRELEVIKDIEPSLYRRLMKIYKKIYDDYPRAFVMNRLVLDVFAKSIFVSASFPPTLLEAFKRTDDEYPTYMFRCRRGKDTIILLNQELWWIRRDEWRKKLYPQLLEIVKESVERHGAVGIVSRNYEQTRELEELFESVGFKVWSDRRDSNQIDYRDADVVIITTKGKGFRGVNIFTRKSGQGDFRVIIAFFQAHGLNRANIHPVFYNMMDEDVFDEDSDEIGSFIEELTYANNFQALFRFNRFRTNKHIMILLDKRWWKALTLYAWQYYHDANVINVDIDDVARVAVPIIRSFR